MKLRLHSKGEKLESKLGNTEVAKRVVEWCEFILSEKEYEAKCIQADRLRSELPSLKAEFSQLASMEQECESDLAWIDARVDELSEKNRELLDALRRSKK